MLLNKGKGRLRVGNAALQFIDISVAAQSIGSTRPLPRLEGGVQVSPDDLSKVVSSSLSCEAEYHLAYAWTWNVRRIQCPENACHSLPLGQQQPCQLMILLTICGYARTKP